MGVRQSGSAACKPFLRFVAKEGKPLKRLEPFGVPKHRAKATVLMKCRPQACEFFGIVEHRIVIEKESSQTADEVGYPRNQRNPRIIAALVTTLPPLPNNSARAV
jgi:hypothetical protein